MVIILLIFIFIWFLIYKTMTILIGLIIVAFIIGLVSRDKGDGFMDTLGSGCSTIIFILVAIAIIIYFSMKN